MKSIEREKGAWTKREHEFFLLGLKRLGKGNWKNISAQFVRTRTASQVASHAQKYFERLQRRRRGWIAKRIVREISIRPKSQKYASSSSAAVHTDGGKTFEEIYAYNFFLGFYYAMFRYIDSIAV